MILLTRLSLILLTSFIDLILLTSLLSWYYSQESAWYILTSFTDLILLTRLNLILLTSFTDLILLTSLLSWYYSQDSAWYYSQALQHHHLNHMMLFVGLDINHKSIVLILLTRLDLILLTSLLSWYYSQDWRMTPDVVISTLPLSKRDIFCHTKLISKVFKLHHR